MTLEWITEPVALGKAPDEKLSCDYCKRYGDLAWPDWTPGTPPPGADKAREYFFAKPPESTLAYMKKHGLPKPLSETYSNVIRRVLKWQGGAWVEIVQEAIMWPDDATWVPGAVEDLPLFKQVSPPYVAHEFWVEGDQAWRIYWGRKNW